MVLFAFPLSSWQCPLKLIENYNWNGFSFSWLNYRYFCRSSREGLVPEPQAFLRRKEDDLGANSPGFSSSLNADHVRRPALKAHQGLANLGLLLSVLPVDQWGSHGMAVHPIRLINVVGALDFAKSSQNQYLQVSASIF